MNGNPHIGHMYEIILADILTRFSNIQYNRTFLLTGSDEHGKKIQSTAKDKRVNCKELCDGNGVYDRGQFKTIFTK